MALTTLSGKDPSSATVTSAAVLRVNGASSWTGADPNSGQQRYCDVTNVSGSDIYIKKQLATTTLTGSVSSSSFNYLLQAGQTLSTVLAPGYDLAVISAASSVVFCTQTVMTA